MFLYSFHYLVQMNKKKVILQIVLFNPDYNISVSDKQIVSILQHNNCLV